MKKSAVPNISGFTKVQVSSFVKMKLKTNAAWAVRAAARIYDYQTGREKNAHISLEHNGVGFTRFDAPLLTHLVCRARQNRVSEQDLTTLKAIMPKYWAQVIVLSNKDELRRMLNQYYKIELPF